MKRYTVLLTPDAEAGGYAVTVPTLPGCVTEGDTLEEALENTKDAIALYLKDLTAKRWRQQTIGVDLVQRLIGSVVTGKCASGVFITTSTFTAGAQEVVKESGVSITLIDGQTLLKLMLDEGLGIKETPVVRRDVDEGFFDTL